MFPSSLAGILGQAANTPDGYPIGALTDDALVVGTGLGALAAGIVAGYTKFIKPKLASIDNAVNHGRMERIELQVQRNSGRTDRIEERLDTHVAQLNDRLHAIDERTTAGQQQILAAVERQRPNQQEGATNE